MVVETGYLFKRKNEIKSVHEPFTKLVLRDCKHLNVKIKTLKAIENNIGEYPYNSCFRKVLLKKDLKSSNSQKNIDKCDSIKIILEDTIKIIKEQDLNRKKINYIFTYNYNIHIGNYAQPYQKLENANFKSQRDASLYFSDG